MSTDNTTANTLGTEKTSDSSSSVPPLPDSHERTWPKEYKQYVLDITPHILAKMDSYKKKMWLTDQLYGLYVEALKHSPNSPERLAAMSNLPTPVSRHKVRNGDVVLSSQGSDRKWILV